MNCTIFIFLHMLMMQTSCTCVNILNKSVHSDQIFLTAGKISSSLGGVVIAWFPTVYVTPIVIKYWILQFYSEGITLIVI